MYAAIRRQAGFKNEQAKKKLFVRICRKSDCLTGLLRYCVLYIIAYYTPAREEYLQPE